MCCPSNEIHQRIKAPVSGAFFVLKFTIFHPIIGFPANGFRYLGIGSCLEIPPTSCCPPGLFSESRYWLKHIPPTYLPPLQCSIPRGEADNSHWSDALFLYSCWREEGFPCKQESMILKESETEARESQYNCLRHYSGVDRYDNTQYPRYRKSQALCSHSFDR